MQGNSVSDYPRNHNRVAVCFCGWSQRMPCLICQEKKIKNSALPHGKCILIQPGVVWLGSKVIKIPIPYGMMPENKSKQEQNETKDNKRQYQAGSLFSLSSADPSCCCPCLNLWAELPKAEDFQTIPRKMLGRKTCNKLNLGMQFQLVERDVNSTCQSSLLVEKVRTFIALSLNLWVLHCRRDIFIYCSVFSVFHSTLWNIFALWVPERHR